GGAGFIGGNFVLEAVARGVKVINLDALTYAGNLKTLSSLVRMMYSRAGAYPAHQPMLYAEDFSPNTPQGACSTCPITLRWSQAAISSSGARPSAWIASISTFPPIASSIS
ncbi:hypothetical protein ABGA94_00055, partial [Stenotrophomonas sp. 3diitr2024]